MLREKVYKVNYYNHEKCLKVYRAGCCGQAHDSSYLEGKEVQGQFRQTS
jgi:hypothetical protein